MRLFLFLLTMSICQALFCQDNNQQAQPINDTSFYLSRTGLQHIINAKMGSLVTGQSTGTGLGNFAGFDPVAGAFTFKGTICFNNNPNDSTTLYYLRAPEKGPNISFLSFKIAGDLISDSYASLFSKSKLNTNSVIEVQYHFRRKEMRYKLSQLATDQTSNAFSKKMLYLQKIQAVDKLKDTVSHRMNRIVLLDQVTVLQRFANTYNDSVNKYLGLMQHYAGRSMADSANFYSDKVDSYRKTKAEVIDKIGLKNKEADSLLFLIDNRQAMFHAREHILTAAYNKAVMEIEAKEPISGISFGWFTITSGVSKKKYYSFDRDSVFAKQLPEKELSTFRAGLTYNYYSEKIFPRRIILFNIGFLRYKDNNTALLSTQNIVQETVIKNAGGDTTRKVVKNYAAYTDPVTESKLWEFFANLYLVHSSKMSALHLYPTFQVLDKGKDVFNGGIGYIVSFKNTKKDNPAINIEAYLQFSDMLNSQKTDTKFFRRNELGIRFALPFSIF